MPTLKPFTAKPQEVRALLAGATQIWRPVPWEPYPGNEGANWEFSGYEPGHYFTDHPETGHVLYSRGGSCWHQRTQPAHPPIKPGERYFVQEDYDEVILNPGDRTGAVFACDPGSERWTNVWTPADQMPERLSRLAIEGVSVEVKRFGAMTEHEAAASVYEDDLARFEHWDGDPDRYRKVYRTCYAETHGCWRPLAWAFAITVEVVGETNVA